MYAAKARYKSDEEAGKLVEEALVFAEQNRSSQAERWKDNRAAYLLRHNYEKLGVGESSYPYESDLKLPTELVHTEGVTTMVALAFLSGAPLVAVNAKKADDAEAARKYEWKIQSQLVDDIGIREKLPRWVRDSCKCIKWIKIGWTTTTNKVMPRRFDPHKPEGQEDLVAIEEDESRGMPTWEGLYTDDVYWDPWATPDNPGRFMVHHVVWTPEQFERYVKATEFIGDDKRPWNMEMVEALLKNARDPDKAEGEKRAGVDLGQDERLSQLEANKRRGGYAASKEDSRLLHIYDYWENEIHIVAVGDRGAFVCPLREPNPFAHGQIPFIELVFLPQDDDLEGLSLLDAIGDLAHEKNTRRNQRNDNVKYAINTRVCYNKLMFEEGEEELLASRPFGPIPFRGSPEGQVVFDHPPDVTSQAYLEGQLLDEDMANVSGWSNPLTGGDYTPGETARGTMARQGAASRKFDLVIVPYAAALRRAIKMTHAMNRQFLGTGPITNKEGSVRVPQDDGTHRFMNWTYADINRDYQLEWIVDPMAANRGQQFQQLTNYMASTATNPEAAQYLEWIELHTFAFQAMGWKDDARRFLKGMDTKAQLENKLLLQSGVMPDTVTDDDDDEEHIEAHGQLAERGALAQLPPELQEGAARGLTAHLQRHDEQIAQKRDDKERVRAIAAGAPQGELEMPPEGGEGEIPPEEDMESPPAPAPVAEAPPTTEVTQ